MHICTILVKLKPFTPMIFKYIKHKKDAEKLFLLYSK